MDKKSYFDNFLGKNKALTKSLAMSLAASKGVRCKASNFYKQYNEGFEKEMSYVMHEITSASPLFWQDPQRFTHSGRERAPKKG